MSELLADSLPVGIRRASDGNGYEVGFTWQGVFRPFGYVKAPGFDADVQAAKQAQTDAQVSQAPVTPQ
jgi:hypothetical protein